MQARELYQALLRKLTLPVDEGEKQAMIRWLLEDRVGLSAAELMTEKNVAVEPRHFDEDIKRLNLHEPLHYVLGHADFHGRRFRVNSSVLIPRPETELLVRHVVETLGPEDKGSLLDIGTGSGCIAISLALELPGFTVLATDVDPSALAVARDNARLLGAAVRFRQHNILEEELSFEDLDAVVSNPPYIRKKESDTMAPNVLGFEPHHALFVPDDDPLVFHRAIARKARLALKPGGLLAMEINEALGAATREEVERAGFSSVVIHPDLDGKDRFVTAIRNY